MDINGINTQVTSTQAKTTQEQQETIQRVQTEFLSQLCKGVNEQEAFKNSLKAIDAKYNPQEDTFQATNPKDCAMTETAKLGGCFKSIKMPKPETVVTWLTFISEVLPKLLEIINMLPKPQQTEQPANANACVA